MFIFETDGRLTQVANKKCMASHLHVIYKTTRMVSCYLVDFPSPYRFTIDISCTMHRSKE